MFWDNYFKGHDESPPSLFRTIAQLIQDKNFGHAEAAIKGYLRYHGKAAEPWMYIWLVKAIEARNGTDAEKKTAIAFAALLAKRTRNPTDLIRIADMMVLRNYYGTVGDPKYETNIAELIDMAAEKVPAHPVPPMMSINLAGKVKDPKRMGDSAERLLSLGWPGLDVDDRMRKDVAEQVGLLVKALRDDGRTDEADALAARLVTSQARDILVILSWTGEADIDLAVEEPLGAIARYQTPRTVFGGSIILNGYGKHPKEVYVCPRAFDGDYTIKVDTIFSDPANPAKDVKLLVVTHEGTANDEKRQEFPINLDRPTPIVVKLTGGRRKEVLPFLAPPEAPPVVEKPKAAKEKEAPKAVAPRPGPVR